MRTFLVIIAITMTLTIMWITRPMPTLTPDVYHILSFESINENVSDYTQRPHCRIKLQNNDIRITAESVVYCEDAGVTLGMTPRVSSQDIILPNESSYAAACGQRFKVVRAELRHEHESAIP